MANTKIQQKELWTEKIINYFSEIRIKNIKYDCMNTVDKDIYMFDLGNVTVINIYCNDKIREYYNLPKEEFEQDYRDYEYPLSDGYVSTEEYWKHVEKRFGVKINGNPFYDFFSPEDNLIIKRLLTSLKEKGKHIIAATNTIEPHWRKVSKLPAISLFDRVYLSYEMGLSKPAPAFFKTILKEENILSENAFFIDDIESYAHGAIEAGVKDTLIFRGEDKESKLKDAFSWLNF